MARVLTHQIPTCPEWALLHCQGFPACELSWLLHLQWKLQDRNATRWVVYVGGGVLLAHTEVSAPLEVGVGKRISCRLAKASAPTHPYARKIYLQPTFITLSTTLQGGIQLHSFNKIKQLELMAWPTVPTAAAFPKTINIDYYLHSLDAFF